MIPIKNLFTGALGKSINIGGSKLFSTPHTVDVPPQYTIETDVPSVAEFLSCSLDGRLWLFRRSRRFYLAVIRWNEDTQRLVFVTSAVLSNENLIMRGIDWFLTDKSFIRALDDEPFFSRIEYASDDATYINAIHHSYSFFPELETWQQITSGQIIQIEGSPSDLWKVIPQSELTPLELHYYSYDNIQPVNNFYPKLSYSNGRLYAKGKAHIGRAYLLPRSFYENGDIENFYLYICPDYKRAYDTENLTFDDNDGWDNLIIAPLNQSSACFFTPEDNDYGFCKKPVNSKVTSLPQLQLLDFSSNNGTIFFDGFSLSNLLLNDTGVSLLYDNLNYECKGLRQWIAPTENIKTVNQNMVIASYDSFSLATHINSAFFREKISAQVLPLTSCSYSGKKIAMGNYILDAKRSITVNKLPDESGVTSYVNWNNIYMSVVNIEIVNVFQQNVYDIFKREPLIFYTKRTDITSYYVVRNLTNRTFETTQVYSPWAHGIDDLTYTASETYEIFFNVPGTVYDYNTYLSSINTGFVYIDLNTGTPFVYDYSCHSPDPTITGYEYDYMRANGSLITRYFPCHISTQFISHSESFLGEIPTIIDNHVVFRIQEKDFDMNHTVEDGNSNEVISLINSNIRYDNVFSLPDDDWQIVDDSVTCNILLTEQYKKNFLIFTEKSSNINFYMDISQTLLDNNINVVTYFRIFNFYHPNDIITDNNGNKYIIRCTHVCVINNQYFIILRSQYNPDIFNFDAEIERSKFF